MNLAIAQQFTGVACLSLWRGSCRLLPWLEGSTSAIMMPDALTAEPQMPFKA